MEIDIIKEKDIHIKDSDEILVERVKNGSKDAYAELVRRYMKKAYSIAYQFLGNSEDAKDISQDVFVKIYQSIGRFKEGHKFFSWFYKILINHCINVRRKKVLLPFIADDFTLNTSPDEEMIEDNIDRQELKSEVNRAISKLPLKQRRVLILCEIEGLSQKEVSEMINISEGTVRSRLFYARKRLQKHLNKYVKQ